MLESGSLSRSGTERVYMYHYSEFIIRAMSCAFIRWTARLFPSRLRLKIVACVLILV